MNQVVSANEVESKIIELRGEQVILDSDVAELYGVETKRINEAVKNNLDKFPGAYILELGKDEWDIVKSKFSTSPLGGGKTKVPKAFTEKGLYMLATILKSQRATETTLSIIETFSKVREIARTIKQLPVFRENSPTHQALMRKTGDLISDLLVPEEWTTSESEASLELNFAVAKLKYSVKKSRREKNDPHRRN